FACRLMAWYLHQTVMGFAACNRQVSQCCPDQLPGYELDSGKISSIITVIDGGPCIPLPSGRRFVANERVIPRAIAGFGVKGAKRSPFTKWKCWKSWAKVIKAGIERP